MLCLDCHAFSKRVLFKLFPQTIGLPWSPGNWICRQCKRPGFWYLGRENPLEKGMVTHSSILAWRIPWTDKPSRLQSMESQRVGHDWVTTLSLYFPWTMVGAEEFKGPCGRIEGQRIQISTLYLSYSCWAFWKQLFIVIIDCAACGLSVVAASRDYSLVMVCRLLIKVASLVVVHTLSCSRACGIFPDQGETMSSSWAGRQILSHLTPRKAQSHLAFVSLTISFPHKI